MSVEVYIARHGQDEDNVKGILNGHRDFPLTNLGRQQAKELAQAIKNSGLEFDAIYASPLSRARETAEIITRVNNIPQPISLSLLIERDFGIMTGKSVVDIEKLCGKDVIKADIITYFLSPEGAETFPDLITRGNEVLEFVHQKHSSGKVLLVCHGDIGKMIYAAATTKPWREVLTDFHFGNGELIDISGVGDAHKVRIVQHNH